MSDPTPNAIRPETAEALQKFKDYVHKRLDDAGVPTDPDSPQKAEGCRIGGRLDWVLSRIAPSPPPSAGSAEERLRTALNDCLDAMEMQEKRQSGEFHIDAETAHCIWRDVMERGRAALAGK